MAYIYKLWAIIAENSGGIYAGGKLAETWKLKLEFDSGNLKSETDNRSLKVRLWQRKLEKWKPKTESGKLEFDSWNLKTETEKQKVESQILTAETWKRKPKTESGKSDFDRRNLKNKSKIEIIIFDLDKPKPKITAHNSSYKQFGFQA